MSWVFSSFWLFSCALAQGSTESEPSRNVSNCPGYVLQNLEENPNGLSASLTLGGTACNAFGTDIVNLTIEVTYETESRLHVNIFDTANKQFTIPENVISRPNVPPETSIVNSSDLVFNYDSTPFAFWITRRFDSDATPLFDTRTSSLPSAPIPPFRPDDNRTAFDGFELVFEDEYLQLTSSLPLNTNIYGLGEYIASSGFRRDVANEGTIQTMWARDVGDPTDENMYGSHPFYLEHRFDESTNTSQSHGVFLLNSAGSDILLTTPSNSNSNSTKAKSLIQYRYLGGTLDMYFFSGPSTKEVVEQYGELVGYPSWVPFWGFGFHLCRWGYRDINDTRDQVIKMREAGIPLEVMWNDIDLYHAFRDFTSDPVSFPGDEMREFIRELAANNQKYIPILDAAVPVVVNDTDVYDPYTSGLERDVFVKNPDGSEYIGQVWPGYTVFPDWFNNDTEEWWLEALTNWSDGGIEFSGIWLDMNEVSSFCEGSCGTGANLSNTAPPFVLPGDPGGEVTAYPECYDPSISGPSGNITINGTLTCTNASQIATSTLTLAARRLGVREQLERNVVDPPYAIHNGYPSLSNHTLATNAAHVGGILDFDVHNMWGMMEERATHRALQQLRPGQRPFIISRSTFPSSGKWTGHWLGDNGATWQYMYQSIQGILQFQLFQIPLVGADTCGFNGNTDEELCNRWMQLSAFTPFYRNHNSKGALSQEPYRWDSVAEASRIAMAARYSLLPYWYTLFANASTRGTPPVRPLFFEFPDEPELFGLDRQFLVGSDILVTPVLTPNVTSVEGILPGRGKVIWRDFFTHQVVQSSNSSNTSTVTVTLPAPLSHINVHVRSGSAILMHAEPGYTIEETRAGGYVLLVSLDSSSEARGDAYVDDGLSDPPGENKVVRFVVTGSSSGEPQQGRRLNITSEGLFVIDQRLKEVTVLGVEGRPERVEVDGVDVGNGSSWQWIGETEELVLRAVNATGGDSGTGVGIDLNGDHVVEWWLEGEH
ncbi:hypothetical protein K435DRAFT_828477 [Dendrothele bispora CBS 962.96]|uniref:alpha-glucosidase n=1 Tax=Dendrothele bispora (strain CBS 962.96) TaxID=1314807 RepID=A0A4S8M7C0_DENBC|nr:hypothetical protein K435DRAFT_828477 [Dendrothele bispora CBS 962.96]